MVCCCSGVSDAVGEIFLLQCHFLRQAGHSEKAVSLFQALLDFTFYKPDSVTHVNTRQQVEFFEPFWDSGEPRVGERGARGWRAWMLQQERGGWVVPPEPEEDEDDEDQDECEIRDKTQPKWRIWLDVETTREANHWLPWRPDKTKGQSEEDCEDPDRQVLFDDIGPSLIRVESIGLKLRLLLAFLRFLGLPDPSAPPPCSLLLDDPALLDLILDSEQPLTLYHLPLTGVSAVGNMAYLSDRRKQVGLCKEGEEFLRNVLEQVLPLFPVQDRTTLSLCWLQYEKLKVLRCVCSGRKKCVKAQGKRSKRVAKRLLKLPENRGSLCLWREYGHLEWVVGNVEEGRRVFNTALAVGGASGLQDHTLCDLCLLYAQLEVEQTCRGGAETSVAPPYGSRALYILSKLAEGGDYSPFSGQVSPVAVLKARRAYENALSAAAGGDKPQSALIGCFGLFQYLTLGIDAADTVFTEARERLTSSAPRSAEPERSFADCEAVCIQHVALLRLHSSASVFPLSRIRLALTDALRHLPCSATLWHLYLLAESRYHSAGRARRFFHSVARGNQSIVPHLFSVTAEQRRKRQMDLVMRSGLPADALPTMPETGLSNRIRSLFEVAVVTKQGAHCPLLWRMYMNFMVCNGDQERGRGLFYKALQNVPWAKGLYMDAVQLFPERVQEFLDLLVEKELRLRAPMEEVEILLEE
ncbi:nuclear exosome regulator NRDE2 [Salminus brasiliensis]|uniref:nuclear exosome regulator NRDE2 n=1 Tax=Salminus brasiliensis TaxID=930266 RepID=UPI003B83723A